MSDKNFRKGPHASRAKQKLEDVVSADAGVVPSSDERKTVVLDEDLEGVEFDDRVWLYWKRNKSFLITSIVLAFAIVIGVQSFKMWRKSAREALATEYANASTPEQLAKFASENSGKALAGVALLQNADTLYADGKFADAQKTYAEASKPLADTVLEGRALLGEASSILAQDLNKGIDALKAVYDNAKIDGAYKSQAGYLLGLAYRQAGKTAEAKDVLKKVSEDAKAGYFARLAEESLSKIN